MVSAYFINFTDPEVSAFNLNAFVTNGSVSPITTQLNSSATVASTSILLYGKGHPDYGERIQENLVNIMENFSGSTKPVFPVSGQTWFDRITYVRTDSGIYRWVDDSAHSAGGTWTEITALAGGSPTTAADTYRSSAGAPLIINDGAFWLQTPGAGSPSTVDLLYLGVNNTTNNLYPSAAWLLREMDDIQSPVSTITTPSGSPPAYLPQKQLKVYDGVGWKNSGNVFTSPVAPQNPAQGDLWYSTTIGNAIIGSPTPDLEDQLLIFDSGVWKTTGYVDTTGDTMTGTLRFGVPASLYIWEGQGLSSVAPDVRATGNMLQTAATNFYIHVDDDDSGTGVFEIAKGSRVTGGSPDQGLLRIENIGRMRSLLGGSPTGSNYTSLVVSGDGSTFTNKDYVETEIAVAQAQVNQNTTDIASNLTLINTLAGGSPIEAKVNRSGDTMSGVLNMNNNNIDMGGTGAIINLLDPVDLQDAATRNYVDTVLGVLGSPITAADGVVTNVSWTGSTRTLTLTRSLEAGSPQNLVGILTHFHPSDEILHEVTSSYLRDLYIDNAGSPIPPPALITLFQEEINEQLSQDIDNRVSTLEAPTEREIFNVTGGSPTTDLTTFNLTNETFIAGTNRLSVFVNGVKQYANERAYQKIPFAKTIPTGSPEVLVVTSESKGTGLTADATVYTLDVVVDGGSPTVNTMSADGNSLQLVVNIIDQINLDIPSVTATWNQKDQAIVIYSNNTGTSSAINIGGDGGSPTTNLLVALDATGIYTLGNVTPAAGGPVSSITRDFSYREVVDATVSTVDANYGESSTSIIFNVPLVAGSPTVDVVEMLMAPAYYI